MSIVANIYLIKDLSRLSGHSIYTLKFYLKRGLIQEAGRSPQTRFRYFNDSTLTTLAQIRVWRKERKSLAEIHRLLHEVHGSTPQEPRTARQAFSDPTAPSATVVA